MNICSQWGESYTKLRRLHSMQLYNLYTSPQIKPTERITTRKEWEGNAARMVDIRKINKKVCPKTRKLETIGRHKLWREYNIKMVLKEIGCKSENWVHLAHVDTEVNFRIIKRGNLLGDWVLNRFSRKKLLVGHLVCTFSYKFQEVQHSKQWRLSRIFFISIFFFYWRFDLKELLLSAAILKLFALNVFRVR